MRRSRRVYQAGPDCPSDKPAAASDDVDGGDRPTKTNASNNDPSQSLTAPRHQDSAAADRQHSARSDKTPPQPSGNGDTTEHSSSLLSGCLCCRRRRTNVVVGENCVLITPRREVGLYVDGLKRNKTILCQNFQNLLASVFRRRSVALQQTAIRTVKVALHRPGLTSRPLQS